MTRDSLRARGGYTLKPDVLDFVFLDPPCSVE